MDGQRFDSWTQGLTATRTRRQALKGAVALALGGALGRFAAPEAALAAQRRTFICPWSEADRGGFQPGNACAQSFRPQRDGLLSKVTVKISNMVSTDADYVVKIVRVDDAGNLGATLAEKTAPFEQVEAGDTVLTAAFAKREAPKLVTSKKYAVVVARPDAPSNGTALYVFVRSNDACPKSDFYTVNPNTGEFAKSAGAFDLVFTAFVYA